MFFQPRYPGTRITTNGNQLVSYYTEARITEGGIFYPITPSTEMGEMYQQAYAEGKLNVFGRPKVAVECEGEHAAQGGAIAFSIQGRRTVNFTSGQGIVYGIEQYYHAPGKLSTMVLEVAARALTKHALNVHCGHDDVYAALDTGWLMLFGKDAQQAADQALIIRKVCEQALTPGMNIQDGFLTSHLERTFLMHESELIREFLGDVDDIIDCPTEAQRVLFGPQRRRVPRSIDLRNPALIGPVQNQEHYMNGVIARRNNFIEPILGFLDQAYQEFGHLTGRHYGFLSEYRTEDADTVYVSLGSAAENAEAAVDYLRETRNAKVGSIHINVIRPFPERAIVEALAGKKNVIILERTDEPLAGDNPIGRDIRTALSKALANHQEPSYGDLPTLSPKEMPHLFSGSYGLGSRDFRPEHLIGAYEYAQGETNRQDGKSAKDGESYFVLGINHPYNVQSDETPSLLPEDSIAVRLHSIGGWGMITTGKNMGEVIGELGNYVAERDGVTDEYGRPGEVIHVSANPKYGSEKKGAPTAYFLVVAPERVRVNCDLNHVDVVLCCDPKAFTHINPLNGLVDGGAFVWESNESPEMAWERIPPHYRQEIIDRNLRVYILPGFEIAREATDRPELQLRMQGNAFLGAFFKVSPFLNKFQIDEDHFREVIHAQYVKKFGRFGEAVVESNMKVMIQGGARLQEVPHGSIDAKDRSSMRGELLLPILNNSEEPSSGCGGQCSSDGAPRAPLFQRETFDKEFRAGLGYHQPASPLSSVGVMAAATGESASKYGARRETPLYIAENCTQCMSCITACPDTALPNTVQDLDQILETAVNNYLEDSQQKEVILENIPSIDQSVRAIMLEHCRSENPPAIKDLVVEELDKIEGVKPETTDKIYSILNKLPLSYAKVNAIFRSREKKEEGSGGIFSIFVSDLCKGCGECVIECGDHEALVMVTDTEEYNADLLSAQKFLDLLPETANKYLGKYNNEAPQESRAATLRNLLMVKRNYDALPSGDGACAGCGEKSVLHAVASVTEAYMRPLYHEKANRLDHKADQLQANGEEILEDWRSRDPDGYTQFKRTCAQIILGLGGETEADTDLRLSQRDPLKDSEILEALIAKLRTEAFNHRDLVAVDGRLDNGMAVMAMGAHTGCNTVYGSTPPNNPHPYPWMNSLFQDGATISWLMGESFQMEIAQSSILPERLVDHLLTDLPPTNEDHFNYTHFSDALMTQEEIRELPKVWTIGGDGGMGDIGFQNVSKVVLQNRPNVKLLLLDTQVYSNTGGQNSDASPMTGGFDMNQLGAATQGKLSEMKNPAEAFLGGHGSPFLAQVSMADEAKFYRSLIEGLEYRGTAFFHCFTTCQPEHGVADDMASEQARRVRDSRGLPEFVFNPDLGEAYYEALSLHGNRNDNRDWIQAKYTEDKQKYNYTVAHWCATEARFRRHLKRIKEADTAGMIPIDNMLLRLTQKDVVNRLYLNKEHRSHIPDFGVYMLCEDNNGKQHYMALSRQMVLFCVERRKAWRLLQSRAGIQNVDYQAQKVLIERVDKGEVSIQELSDHGEELMDGIREELKK